MLIALADNVSGFGNGKRNWLPMNFALGIGFEPGIGIDVYTALGMALVCILH